MLSIIMYVFVMVSSQMPENLLNHTAFTPATQSPVHVLSVSKADRQVTPENAGLVATAIDRVDGVLQPS